VLTERLGTLKVHLVELLRRRGRISEAKTMYREAGERGSAADLNEIAWSLATDPDPKSRDGTNAVVFAEKAVAATNRKNASYLDTLAAALAETGQFAKAINIQQEAITLSHSEQEKQDLASRLRLYENNSPYRDQSLLAARASARLREGKFAEAETLLREELIRVRKLSTNAPSGELSSLGLALHHLADVLRERKALTEARSLAEEAVAMYQRHRDWPSNERQHALQVLTAVLSDLDDFAGLEALYREELARVRKLSTNDPAHEIPELGVILHHLADVRRERKALAEARSLAEEAAAMYQRHPDWPPNERQHAFGVLGDVLTDLEDFLGLEALLHEQLLSLPSEHPAMADVIAQLTTTLLREKKFAEAEPLARECLTIREKKLPNDWRTFNARSLLGGSLLGQEKYAEAEPLLLSGYEGMKQRESQNTASIKLRLEEALQRLVQLYEATGQSGRAAEWKRKLAESGKRPEK